MRLLIAEDELDLAEALTVFFEKNQFTVDAVNDGLSAYEYAGADEYDAIILDVMMQKMDGVEVLRRLRAAGNTIPVLMLTARAEIDDRVAGLDCGADYYLTKPFEAQELLACVRLLLRRGGGAARNEDSISFAGLTLDRATFTLSAGERSTRLSRKEFDICELLLAAKGQVVTKEQLLLKVWGFESDAEDNNVEVYISFLRRKLTFLRAGAKIRTLRMVGYVLEEAENT